MGGIGTKTSIIGHIVAYVDFAKNIANSLINKIIKYTGDGSFLMRQDKKESEELNSAIDKMKDYKYSAGALYRGISIDGEDYKNLVVGAKIKMGNSDKGVYIDAPSSWSSEKGVAENFSDNGSKENKVIFVENSTKQKNAVSIKQMSKYKSEDEVLYSGKTNFKILSIEVTNGKTYVNVKESK